MTPTLSLCLITGDAHLSVLARCLKSFLERPTGPACDELVVGFNGKDDDGLKAVLRDVFHNDELNFELGDGQPAWLSYLGGPGHDRPVAVVVHRGDDPRVVGFDSARNANFAHASGAWRMYADADDVCPLSDDPVIEEALTEGQVLGAAPLAAGSALSLQDWLRSLPPYRNLVLAPYNYVNGDKGPLIRTRRPRIVRWDKFWVWTDRVHEKLVHLLDRTYGVYNPAFVLVHQPILSPVSRQDRNFAILEKTVSDLRARGGALPQQLVYGLAEAAFAQENYLKAAALYLEAADVAPDGATKTMYLVQAARSYIEAGQITDAGHVALKIIETVPEGSEGYLVASEVAFLMKKYDYCVRWYEAGGKHPFRLGGMIDDRIERCMRPAYYVGVAYLMLGDYAKAKAVAEIALATATDPFAARIKAVAEDELEQRELIGVIEDISETLSKRGLLKTSLRLLDAVRGTLPGLDDAARRVRTVLDQRVPEEIPPQSAAMAWLTSAGTERDLKVLVPVDSVDDPAQFVDDVATEAFGKGVDVYLTATDPRANDEYTRLARVDALQTEKLLAILDGVGDVKTLQLLEGESRAIVAAVRPTNVRHLSWRPDFTFFAPVYAEPWGPWRLWRDGTGGSEESVVYLARELARRGYRVQVFAALDPRTYRDVHVEDGVRWRPVEAFNPVDEISGVVIACRAPFAASLPACVPERTYVWHQDAFYSMAWTKALCEAVGHLFVSQWQMNCLLSQVEASECRGAVVGDGIPESCFAWQKEPPLRDPYAVAYLSSPVRGLDFLLDVWPKVMEAEPRASLHVFYGWHTAGDAGEFREKVMKKLAGTKGVVWRDRVPQNDLEVELPKFGVFAYPAEYLEGFCIAGVRATAAGMVPVYATTGAMGEIQHPGPDAFTVKGESTEPKIDRDAFLPALLAGLKRSGEMQVADRVRLSDWARKWTWAKCADKLEQFLEGERDEQVGRAAKVR